MLVDLVGLFNYYQEDMAEAAVVPPPIDTKETGKQPESLTPRREAEVTQVAKGLFVDRIKGKTPAQIDADPTDKKINSSEFFAGMTKKQIKEYGTEVDGGKVFQLEGKPVPIAVWTDAGELSGTLDQIVDEVADDPTKLKVVIKEGEGDSASYFTVNVSRDDIRTANLLAEKDDIIAGFSGDQKQIVQLYFDTIDQTATEAPQMPEGLTGKLDSVARDIGIPTVSFIKEQSPHAEALHKHLEGKVTLESSDIKAVLEQSGFNRENLGEAVINLSDEIKAKTEKLKSEKDHATKKVLKDEIEAMKAERNMYMAVGDQLKEKGLDQLIVTFDKKQMVGVEGVMTAIMKNDVEGAINQMVDMKLVPGLDEAMKELSDADKAAVKKEFIKRWGKRAGIGAAIGMGGPLGLMAILMAAVVATGVAVGAGAIKR